MERTQLFDLMGELKLYGMKAAFDEIMATAVKRQHEPQRVVGDLLNAEINEKQARSIKNSSPSPSCRLPRTRRTSSSRAPPSINQTLVNDLAGGGFIAQQRNAVLVGGTGTGKTHLAIAIARSCIRSGARGRFYNVVGHRQPPGDRDPQRTAGSYRRAFDQDGLHRPRRDRLPAVRSIRGPATVPPRQPALRAHVHRRHHQSRLSFGLQKLHAETQLTGSFRTQNSWYCLQQDVEIEPRRPIADIEKILFPENLQIALAPRRDLP
jgi:hypothetical protein